MSFGEDDTVILHDEHSEYDGEEGTITQVMETMFGDETYTVSFDDGQEAGISEEALELADEGDDEADEDDE
jgi:predicted heme/steroid binding protein